MAPRLQVPYNNIIIINQISASRVVARNRQCSNYQEKKLVNSILRNDDRFVHEDVLGPTYLNDTRGESMTSEITRRVQSGSGGRMSCRRRAAAGGGFPDVCI
jgi:hypothetical protein